MAAEAESVGGSVLSRERLALLEGVPAFAGLPEGTLEELAGLLREERYPAGAVVVAEGEAGDRLYLISAGHAEVSAAGPKGPVPLATLGPGEMFGEAALLTDAPRNATVRALEPCELLALRRADLLEVLGEDRQVDGRMLELLRLRDRPRQASGILVHHRTTATGETVTTLKDPRRGAYYRLSPPGFFTWERLDGEHTLRDLTLEYLTEFKAFAPQAVAGAVGGLAEAGFVEGVRPSVGGLGDVDEPTEWQRATALARRILEWHASIRGVDGPFTRLYGGGVRLLYTLAGQVVLAAIALAGLIAFVLGIGELGTALEESKAGGWLLLFWIPATLVAIVIHEAGHAFTTKHFGREVPRVGVGWYWFGPIAYVDTSDMWLAGRWPRLAVSLAGPYADLVVGGLAALAAWLIPNAVFSAALWQFALVSYVGVLVNFNPLMEFDGYFILSDLLERPNLRPRALAWLGSELIPALRNPQRLRGHRLELLYGMASVLYVMLSVALTVVLYRLIVQEWLSGILTDAAAAGLAWALAAAVVVLAVAGMLGELRGARRPAPGR